jgi:hypothetical protein
MRGNGIKKARQSAGMQQAHSIGLAMYSFANDNGGNYPEGKSSTEVFQKLLDGGYVTNPTVFCVPMAGKSEPVAGQKLKPENVSWDVTSGVTINSPGDLPLVFLTGYKVTYVAGAAAIPITKPYPRYYDLPPRTWAQFWHGEAAPVEIVGMVVFYINNSVAFRNFTMETDPDGSIPHFVSSDFQPDGKTYRQLTPDGPLKP